MKTKECRLQFWIISLLVFLFSQNLVYAEKSKLTQIPQIIGKAQESVVSIQVKRVRQYRRHYTSEFMGQFFSDFLELKQEEKITFNSSSEGTGVIIEASGLIITNAHVIEGADAIEVGFLDNTSSPASVIGKDTKQDLALLQIMGTGTYPVLELADSDKAAAGEEVYAVGTPYGFAQTVTRGIVSAVKRELKEGNEVIFNDLIQTDASINPGSSGGPLLTTEGRMIGMVTAGHRWGRGMNFAISSNRIKSMLEELKTRRKFFERLEKFEKRFGFTVQENHSPEGDQIVLAQVMPDSPGGQSKLLQGDILAVFEKRTPETIEELLDQADKIAANQRIYLQITRHGKPFFTYLEVKS